jgi:hypothetical protein
MSKNLFFLCIYCFAAFSCGETEYVSDSHDTNYYTYFSDKCYYKNPIPLEERMKKEPFDVMKKIEIVTIDIRQSDTILDNSNGKRGFIEKITLTQKDIDTVSQVLNYTTETTQIRKLPSGLKKSDLGISQADCCVPRHALLFYDKNDEIYLKWKICFECNCNRSVRKGKYMGERYIDYYEQYETLRLLFKRIGIKQFIDPERPIE